ncbi:MAG TPA: TolC family protein, partial [Terriglobales bacterium]|nr:TolC family protein [Terriglobales bacterium]
MSRISASVQSMAILWVALAASFGQTTSGGQVSAAPGSTGAPVTLTLQDALERAKKLNPDYRTAVTEYGLAHEDKVQSRAALLPNVNFNTSYLYTEGNGTPSGRFIANNGVHEYISQGNVHQDLSLQNVADYRRTQFMEAAAHARAEVAARGLVVTVVDAYYGFVVAQRKYATAQRADTEAQHFLDISQKLERGGEVAHSDVIKAQIQQQQQHRDLQEAELEMTRRRVELSVLVFPDFTENFSVVDDLQMPEPLPAFDEVQT